MAFPRRLLADHEKLIFDLKPHWIEVVPPILWTLLWTSILVIGYRIADTRVDNPGKLQLTIAAVSLAGWMATALVPALRWQSTRFVLTSDRLITRRGIIAKHSKEIPLERINDVAFSQSILERLIGSGDLLIESAGERGQGSIPNVRKPEQVQLMIYKATEANGNRLMSVPAAVAGPASVPEQIEALARLKDAGTITESEFESKKQELLKRM